MTAPPPATGEAILASWAANAGVWTLAVRDGRIESRRVATDAAIVRAVGALGASRVLDVGCGEGWLARALSGRGMDVIGIDGSQDLVRAAREAGGGTFHACAYGTLVETPLAFGRFDAAVCNFSLFERDLAPLLAALDELLAPAGALVIQTVHPDSAPSCGWQRETFDALGENAFEPMPWFCRSLDAWRREITAAGFAGVDSGDVRHPQGGAPLSVILSARKVR